jgi:predicted HD phosphohydrolase
MCALTDAGIVDPKVAATLKWKRAELKKGDALLFDSYTIHRSSPNTSPNSRRLLYLTYNRLQDGDHRAEYYKSKRKSLAEGHISRIQHWVGKPVADAPRGGETPPSTDDVLNELSVWYDGKVGASLYDKVVTQREHALQCAKLAEDEGADESLIVACLLHDVGHLELDEHAGNVEFLTEDLCHEEVGYKYMESRGFPNSVALPIKLHVPAKRWLCSTDDKYWGRLSDASKRSLEVQGGKMGDEEADIFAAKPFSKEAALLRSWDDRAKTASVSTKEFKEYIPMIRRVLEQGS